MRTMHERDTEAIVAMRNQQEATRYLYQDEPLTADKHVRWLQAAKSRGEVVCVMERNDGTVVGSSSLYDFDGSRTRAEYGRICAATIGADPLTTLEGSILIFRAAFEVAGLHRIVAHVAAANHRTLRHAETIGLRREGLLRQHWLHQTGRDDAVAMGSLLADFRESRAEAHARIYGDDPAPTFSDAQRRNILEVFRVPGSHEV